MDIKRIIKEQFLPKEANSYAKKTFLNLLLNNAMCRSAAALIREIDPQITESWEFSGFSQNGEDGIIDYLLNGIEKKNKYFVEIGSGNGLENNTSYLGHIKKFAGLQIEGDLCAYNEANLIKPWLVENINCFITTGNAARIENRFLFLNPDVFSIDIDGMDYHIMKLLLENGMQPKIIVVEYNSAFGPEKSITIPYESTFNMFNTNHPYLYYGVSLSGWKNLLSKYNYRFLTVESNGINAFFILENEFKDGLFENVTGIGFKENIHQLRLHRKNWEKQFEVIKKLPYIEIAP